MHVNTFARMSYAAPNVSADLAQTSRSRAVGSSRQVGEVASGAPAATRIEQAIT